MTFFQGPILLWLFQVCFSFRSYRRDVNKQIFEKQCPPAQQYFPDIYPHLCLAISKVCVGTTEFKLAYINNREVMCNPRLQSYNLGSNANSHLYFGKSPYTLIYQYDQNGDLIFSTEDIPSLHNFCLVGQKYLEIYKCQYCAWLRHSENCESDFAPEPCGTNCKTCDSTDTKCATCKDGWSPLSSTDLKCKLTCQTGHKTCIQNSSGYSFNGCLSGFELLNGNCVQCPTNCKVCSQGVCQQCMWPYSLKQSNCMGDENCMKYDYVYDAYGTAVDTNCEQCDFGYFKKGTRCASCELEPGLEYCFICHNAFECKSCFSTHYLTANKKCELITIQCNPICQTCYITDPDYCTTCFYDQNLTAGIIPGKCVCDQNTGYADLNGICILCSTGYCLTCTLIFGECTSCDPLLNRNLIGNSCPCLQGYYDPGLDDKICQKCYPSCYNCQGPYDNECTDCGDTNVFHKQLSDGKCICDIRTIEIVESNGLTSCLTCHPRCEKCQLPDDNSSNQYCTMCIVGQNRVVSDDLMCVCKNGYGEDGIVDICFKCHYSCMSCNGPLSTNCTKCSSQNLRHLTSNNECLCDTSYYDKGRNEMLCYLACQYSCLDCDNFGEDQCTSCPSTRQPDRIGTPFKCLCKDSHYYSDESSLECLECHLNCKTCNGINETNCLTCDLTYRQLIISKCDCPYGYYDVGVIECQKCYYTCNTCFGPAIDNCITCSNESNRIVKANICVCKDAHLEKVFGDPICLKCSYRCATCSGTIDKCDTCPDFSFRDLGVDNSCLCPPKSYDEPGNPKCIICHITCLTCIGSQPNQCASCNTVTKRQLTVSGECLCPSKYFDSGSSECQVCSSNCLDCNTSADTCTSCQPDKYLNVNTCICKTKLQGQSLSTYEIQNKLLCQMCHYSCLKCTGRFSNECSSCWDFENRIQSGTSCICKNNYFDVGKPQCSQCNFRCQTCSILDTLCLSCPPLSLRSLNNSQCLCPEGYYDDGINSNCQQCHYSCKTCTQLATKCVSCLDNSKRFFDSILNSCLCNENFYDAGIIICQQCHYSCFKCDGQQYNQCMTCIDQNVSFRGYKQGICQCIIGYYDDGSSIYCKKCKIQCLTCEIQSYNCTSCPLTRHLNGNSCDCDSNYYETGQENCNKCDQNCVNCVNNSTTCTECDSSSLRTLDNLTHKCICQPGTSEINGLCQYCDITCKTCLNITTNCTSCGLMKQLQNTKCVCVQGTYEIGPNKECMFCNKTCLTCINQANYCLTCSIDNFRIFKSGNQCICKDGYFEDTSQQCVKCDLSCLTCQGNSKYCLSCDPTFSLQLSNQNQCICMSGYYFNTISKLCEVCNIKCKECQNATQCIECEPLTRYYNSDTFSCLCKGGFFETNQKFCQQCDLSCKTCISQSTKCQTCEPIYFRLFNNINQCLCQDGYFDIGIEMCQKCNSKCKTCQVNSSKCLSCFEIEQIRILKGNSCVCKTGYFDNGQLICEKCSKSCLTCSGKKDYCTSCDINQNRIDQSPIHKCPCLSNFFQNQDEVCQKCHIKCSGCIQQRDKCISCVPSKTANRLLIAQNCACKNGFYDDGIQLQCQKCNHNCRTCIGTPENCLTCFSNLREKPPACQCKAGYFEDEQLNCQPCDNQCGTCEKQSSNCTSCKKNRTNKTCDCQEGYFEAGQPDCLKCNFQCQTCKNNKSNCQICKGDRINNPVCNCQDGFYDNHLSLNCIMCDPNCKTCNLEGCLACNGNRLLSKEKTCNCPQNSISHQNTPWCSNCEVAVLDIRFSDDLLQIKVKFDFSLNPNSFLFQFQSSDCFKILAQQTIKLLGNNPQCIIDLKDDKQLLLQLGQNASILPNDPMIFLNKSFRHKSCTIKLNRFIFNTVQFPLNLISPQIEYDITSYSLNPCDDNTILIKSKIYDGLRAFKSISWTYLVEGQNGNGHLEEFVQDQTTFQQLDLMLPSQTLPKQSKITFYVQYQNFIDQQSQYQIQVNTHSGQFPTVLWQGKKQYYTFELIDLLFKISKRNCSSLTQIENDNSVYNVSLVEIYRNDSNSRSSGVDVSQKISENYFNMTIQRYQLTTETAYTFEMQTLESQSNFSNSQNQTIQILKGGLLCSYDGTKKIQNYRKDLLITIKCRDVDNQYEWNEDSDIKIEVNCVDLTKNGDCEDLNKKIIKINNTDTNQFIKKMTVQPYTIQAWSVIASKQQSQYYFQQNIVFLENEAKILDVQYSNGYNMRPINNYETLQVQFNISLEDKLFLLQYQIAIIYDYEIIKILEPQHYLYNFRLFDHYQEFSKGNSLYLKFLAQFTNDIIPSQYDLQLTLNQPPICHINLKDKTFDALKSQKIIANCEFSEDSPYKYQLRFFLNEQDYLDFNNKVSDYSLILNSFQRYNYFDVQLPQCQGVVLIQIMDSRGSITNIEQHLNIVKIKFNCSDYSIRNFSNKYQIILLLEVIMNHFDQEDCVQFSEQLIRNIKSYLNSEDLFDQLLTLQTIKLYKRFKVDFQKLNSSTRLLAQTKSQSCYDNTSKLFFINNAENNKTTNNNISNFVQEFSELNNSASQIFMKSIMLENEMNQDEIFMNEQQFQSKEQLTNSLAALILFVDDLFLKIAQTSYQSDEDKNQIIVLSQNLLNLIDEILQFSNEQVAVNGQVFTINGQILQYQSTKITKQVFNSQEGLEKDIMDGYVVFVQKEQLNLNFNYLNISQKHFQEIQNFVKYSTLQIDQNLFSVTKIRNFLQKNQYRDYERLNTNYLVDLTKYSNCVDQFSPEYHLQCLQYDKNGILQQCNLQVQEANNESVRVSCQCSSLGIIFLIRYQNQSLNGLEQVKILNNTQTNQAHYNLHNQPFFFFHSIYIVITLFIYFGLLKYEAQTIVSQNGNTEILSSPTDQEKAKTNQINCYPGNVTIFKQNMKFIHEVICIFYCEDQIIRKSYRFLKMSVFLSCLIPLSLFETFFIEIVTLIAILIINYIILLLLRALLKILEAIYRFKGIFGILICTMYILIHLFSYALFISQLLQSEYNLELNKNMSIIIVCTIFVSYAIFDPLIIYLRVVLYKEIISLIKVKEFNPINRFFYFFIHHYKLQQIFDNYTIL